MKTKIEAITYLQQKELGQLIKRLNNLNNYIRYQALISVVLLANLISLVFSIRII